MDWEQEADSEAYEAKEAGLWVGSTLVGYESNATGNIFQKVAGQRIVHRFQWTTVSGTLTTFTFDAPISNSVATESAAGIVRLATAAQMSSGGNNRVGTAARVRTFVEDAIDNISGLRRPRSRAGHSPWRESRTWQRASSRAGRSHAARIPNLAASKITSGILNVARIPGLAASKITSGVRDTAHAIPGYPIVQIIAANTTFTSVPGRDLFSQAVGANEVWRISWRTWTATSGMTDLPLPHRGLISWAQVTRGVFIDDASGQYRPGGVTTSRQQS